MKITAIKQQLKRADRYSVFVDDAYAFSLSESGLLESQLASGQELDEAQLALLKKSAGLDKAYGNALRFVAMRPRSEWEVASYLARKQIDAPAGAQIVARLKAAGLLDDAAFARMWVENRRLLRQTSARRLKLELAQKHVPEEIVVQVLQAEPGDERALLAAVITKKRRQSRYQNDPLKLMQYLARQGFGYDDIKRALAGPADE
jgi:regulatory protein